MKRHHRIQFPPADVHELAQDEVFFHLVHDDGEKETIRLHDYDRIFALPGLYEQLIYDRLKCQSPTRVVSSLHYALDQSDQQPEGLRVLDIGAGNGMVGEEIARHGAARIVGLDIIPEARDATERDRPGVYDDYYVVDLTDLSDDEREDLESWSFNCLVSVAALGFGDLPVEAFVEAFNLVSDEGWVAFNVKETFLNRTDTSGFSRLVRELLFSDHLDIDRLERYRHRFSVEGEPLYYYALAGRKHGHVPPDLVAEIVDG